MSLDPATPLPPETEGGASLFVSPDAARLVLTGEIDVALRAEITELMEEALRTGLRVEVDARGVTFMDSSGVSLIARLATRTPQRLVVVDPPEVVRFLLEVTRIEQLVDVVGPGPSGV
jgi:anti-anti-sigma factor